MEIAVNQFVTPKRSRTSWLVALVALAGIVGASCSSIGPGSDDDAGGALNSQTVEGDAASGSDAAAADSEAEVAEATNAEGEDEAEPAGRLSYVDEDVSLIAVIKSHPDLTQLAALIEGYPQQEVFTQARGVTLLAPSDAALAAMDADALEQLAQDPTAFTLLLSNHLTVGTLASDTLVSIGEFSNAAASVLPVSQEGGTIQVGEAVIVEADLTSENGVIHIIDRVISG